MAIPIINLWHSHSNGKSGLRIIYTPDQNDDLSYDDQKTQIKYTLLYLIQFHQIKQFSWFYYTSININRFILYVIIYYKQISKYINQNIEFYFQIVQMTILNRNKYYNLKQKRLMEYYLLFQDDTNNEKYFVSQIQYYCFIHKQQHIRKLQNKISCYKISEMNFVFQYTYKK
ncbi:unnamed protein product [Paramecium sonneborni]|uniref:Transmembrane protein n=1 Tax=Paramecium sonneborni TaxID=65129 RepID=A0A8S1R3E8_9CILI|nr:unnamed protein product [Paramecium sonneborni]